VTRAGRLQRVGRVRAEATAYLVVRHEFVDARLELLLAEPPEEDLHALVHVNGSRLVLRSTG